MAALEILRGSGPGSDHLRMSDRKAPPPVPPAFARQRAMAAQRVSESVRPDDSASVASSTWSVVREESNFPPPSPHPCSSPSVFPPAQPMVPKAPPKGFEKKDPATLDPWAEAAEESDDLAEIPQDVRVGASSSAFPAPSHGLNPATEAAKTALGKKEKQLLDQQKARAKQKNRRGLRWGQFHQVGITQNFELPWFIRQLGSKTDERSILILDSRDARIQSPFQGWLLDEILLNSHSEVNVLADRQSIRTPISGYHMNLFYMKTIDGFKVIIVGSMTSYTTVPCARWDTVTGDVLSHEAFQPFRWPIMREDSPTWVDVKIKVEGFLLLHLEMRGYRSDQDMSVQLNYLNDSVIMNMQEQLFVPSAMITVFQGWRVIATTFEVGGRLYACSDGGVVVALDYPLCHFEFRMTAISSKDNLGNDADRLEFKFYSAGDKVNVACSQISVPSSYLVVSRVSGSTLVNNANWCRGQKARVEGPDQVMQMSQLAGVHAHWTSAIEAVTLEDTGPRVSAIGVASHPQNAHLTCESPLYKSPKVTVPKEAIALQCHDPLMEREAMVVPPVTDGPSVVSIVGAPSALKALVGPASSPLTTAGAIESEVSVTEAGKAPVPEAHGEGVLHVQRRSMETRLNETIAAAAVTPQDFVSQVQRVVGTGGSTTSAPRSFGPEPRVEEIEEL